MNISSNINSTGNQPSIISGHDKTWFLYMLAMAGALISIVPDLVQNENAAVIVKIVKVFVNTLKIPGGYATLLALAILMATSIILCVVYMPKTRMDAFLRGAAALLVLTSGVPYDSSKLPSGPIVYSAPKETSHRNLNETNTRQTANLISGLIRTSYAADLPEQKYQLSDEGNRFANSTVFENNWISYTKPKHSGLLGLGSLLGNTIEIDKKDHTLEINARVRIIDKWDSGFRGYRYVKVQYMHDNCIFEGWIWAGQEPNYWIAIRPDNAEDPMAEDYEEIVIRKFESLLKEYEATKDISKRKEIANLCFAYYRFYRKHFLSIELEPYKHKKRTDKLNYLYSQINNRDMQQFKDEKNEQALLLLLEKFLIHYRISSAGAAGIIK